jgi:hypothetical protein
MTSAPTLFDEVVEASGLNSLIAPFTVSRLLLSADVQPQELTPGALTDALPHLEEGLAVYLRGEDLARALEQIRRLAADG